MFDELKPCPFCGGTNLKMCAFYLDPSCYVECECGAQLFLEVDWKEGMTGEEHDEACYDALLAAWNRRRDAPIRCENCKYASHLHEGESLEICGYLCGLTGQEMRAEDFCSQGERIDKNE